MARLYSCVLAVYTAVYMASTRPCNGGVHVCVCTRLCTRPVHSRIQGPSTQPVYGSVNVRVHGPCTRPRTRPVVYMADRPTGPCTSSQTARYGPVRPATAVYMARSQPVHGSVYVRVRRPLHGRRQVHTSTPQLKGRARAMYTSVYTASTQSCTWQVGLHGRVHGPRLHVTAVGCVHGRNAPCTRSCTRPIHSRIHCRDRAVNGPCTRP